MSSGIPTAPPALHWFLLEPGADLSCTPLHHHFLIPNNEVWIFSVVKPYAAELQARCGHAPHAHLGWGSYLLAFSGEKRVSSQDKDLLCFVRWLHVEMSVTITIFDIFSEIIVLSLKVWKTKRFIDLPVCETAYGVSSFVSLSNISSWYSKKLWKVTVSKYKMTAKDIVMLPGTSYSCSA